MANMIEEEDQQVFELIPPFWKNKISLIDGTTILKRIFFNRFILITKKQTILQWIILPNSSYLKKNNNLRMCDYVPNVIIVIFKTFWLFKESSR